MRILKLTPIYRILLNSLIVLLLLRLVKRLSLSAAKASGKCGRLTTGYSVIHEVVAISDSVVIRALKTLDFSYYSRDVLMF